MNGPVQELDSISICPFVTGVKYGMSVIVTGDVFITNEIQDKIL